MDIVPHQNAVTCKGKEGFQRFLFAGASATISLVMPVSSVILGVIGLPGLTKVSNSSTTFAIADDDRADLGQVLHPGVKTGGLGVKHAELAVQRLILYAVDAGDHVVHKVGFAAVDELEVRVFLWMSSAASMASG